MTEPIVTDTTPDVCRKAGHPWTPENTIRRMHRANGKEREIRQCRACARAAAEARRRRADTVQQPAGTTWRLRCVECDSGGLADDYEGARALAGQHASETGHHVAAEEVAADSTEEAPCSGS